MHLPAHNLQAIATEAGVSRMTVSRVLRKQNGVSDEVRKKVLGIARNLGYRPNPLVTALMTNLRAQRSRPSTETGTVLAFVERADQPGDVRPEHFAGASQAAEEQGYKLEPFIIGKAGMSPEQLNRMLTARNIRGILIAPLPEEHGSFNLNWDEFCTVVIEYTFNHPVFDRVVHDHYTSIRLMLEKCRLRGLRRVGLVLTTNGHARTEGLYEAAYWLEQKERQFFKPIPPLLVDEWNPAELMRWIKRHRPEVLIASNLPIPLRKFWDSKRDIEPNWPFFLNINSQESDVSGVSPNNPLIGATAARLLIDKMNRNDQGIPPIAQTVLIPGRWMEGKTFGEPPAHDEQSKKDEKFRRRR